MEGTVERANAYLKDKGLIEPEYKEFVITHPKIGKVFLGELMADFYLQETKPTKIVIENQISGQTESK